MNNDTLGWIPVVTEIEELDELWNVNEFYTEFSPLVQPQVLQGYHGVVEVLYLKCFCFYF